MHRPHRRRLPAVLASLVALALLPIGAGGVAADTTYSAACAARLRSAPSTGATTLVTLTAGTIVTVTGSVPGDPWSASCPGDVAGTDWFTITSVGGASVSTLFGVGVAYAAAGLFQPSLLPPPPPPAWLEGVDVSTHQGAIDWSQVAGAGKRFAAMKATEGQTYLDPTYAANHAGARAAGLPTSAYHFAYPLRLPNDPVIQADWFVQNAAILPGDLVPALDLERTGGLSVAELQDWVGAWLAEVTAKLGVRPMIYTSPSFWKTSMGDTTIFADQGYTVLWVAHWFMSSPTAPAASWGGRGWTFWQYSDCGSVPGIAGCVDLDRYNGTDLGPLTYGSGPVPPATPNSPPAISALVPADAPAGGGDLALTVQGSGFSPGTSVVYWNGIPLATTYVSPWQLTAVVPAILTASPGLGSVMVIDLSAGAGSGAPVLFTVGSAAPPPAPPPSPSPSPTPAPAPARLALASTSALGTIPGARFSAATPKVQRAQGAVTWRFSGGAALAGQRVNVLVSRRVGGRWGPPAYLKSAWADKAGVVLVTLKDRAGAVLNVRIQWPGGAGYGLSTSPALGAYWR